MRRSPLLPIHETAGARLTAPEQGSQLLTYGDVPAEYRAATEGCAVFDETERGLVAVRGADAPTFLHGLLANDVRGLEPGFGCRNLLLTAKGKVVHDFVMGPIEDGFALSTEPGQAPDLITKLDMYLFAEDVQLLDCTDDHAPISVCGPDARGVLASVLGVEPPADDHHPTTVSVEGRPVTVTRLPVHGSPGWRLDGGAGAAAPLFRAVKSAGAVPSGIVVRDILRVEAARALWGVDVDDGIYPQEARLYDAFSLDKGCYIGQEVVAKIDTYGGLNKAMFALRVSHDDPVPAGSRLFREQDGEWRDIGVVTSWAYSFVLDTGVVLAYLKRKHQDEGTSFRIDDGPGEATIVPLPVRDGAVPVGGLAE